MKILKVCIIILLVIVVHTNIVKTYNYYDLFFEKTSESVIKEKSIDINTEDKIKIMYNQNLSKDEMDTINYHIKDYLSLNKILNKNLKQYDNKEEVIITYVNIKGILIKDYKSWCKSENVNILIPINIE